MPTSDLRLQAQVMPTITKVICISPNAKFPGAYSVDSAGNIPGNATDQEIMDLIAIGQRLPLPPRVNPFDLIIEEQPTKIVFYLDDANWFFTERQFRLKDGSENDTPTRDGGVNREFGSLEWVDNNGTDRQKTFSIIDTWRRMIKFEYGIFIAVRQGDMETIIEIDPDITNEGCG